MTVEERNDLVMKYDRMVKMIASRVADRYPHVPEEDFRQRAYEGLIRAIDAYDPSKRVKLITYAFQYSRWYALRALDDQDYLGKSQRAKLLEEGVVTSVARPGVNEGGEYIIETYTHAWGERNQMVEATIVHEAIDKVLKGESAKVKRWFHQYYVDGEHIAKIAKRSKCTKQNIMAQLTPLLRKVEATYR
jgi:RNA polymerase sigma factor (sigma-70 family)